MGRNQSYERKLLSNKIKLRQMSILFTLLFVFTFLSASAAESRKLRLNYSIDSSIVDLSLKKNQSKFHFTFKNHPLSYEAREFYYATGKNDKENLIGKMDEKNQFVLNTESGIYRFQFYHSDNYYEITTDSIPIGSQSVMYISLYLEKADEMIIVDKPVIYLYPTIPTLVEVKVEPKGEFIFTYPIYNKGWKIKANPSGDIEIASKTYNYLFWESSQLSNLEMADFDFGFIVEKENTIAFLEEKLTEFGLNSKEQADFITYWGPKLITNSSNFVHFIVNEDCNQFAELTITPKPDHIYRIYMLTMNLEAGMNLKPINQVITKINRDGFTVIEWGGSEISTLHSPSIPN